MRTILVWWSCLLAGALALRAQSAMGQPEPKSARDFFNLGAVLLKAGKHKEAEAQFESALVQQEPEWQSPALYNLGHVRFAQGQEELKKGPPGRAAAAQGQQAAANAFQAIGQADQALAGNNVDQLIAAYTRGRGARRELKTATQVVQRALKTHQATLLRWQRSASDFRGAQEVQPSNADAEHNAKTVDEEIARLIDSIRDMQQAAQAMKQAGEGLKEKMRQMKGRIPAPNMPPGAPGEDEEEEEDQPQGPPPGTQEAPSKEGEEMQLTPEQAGWMLETFRLDSERRLPMGQNEQAIPLDKNRPTW